MKSTFFGILTAFVALAIHPVKAQQVDDGTPSAVVEKPKDDASDTPAEPVDQEKEVPPHVRAKNAFAAPPGSVILGKTNNLWIDRKAKRLYMDGYVTLRRGALEMFACPAGTKEHESVVATLAKARDVHAGLLAIDATSGTPVRHLPEFLPPTGQVIRVWVCWQDKNGKFKTVDARDWVKKQGTEKETMKAEWVFAGSSFWTDPSDGKEYYQADAGDLICVSNFATAMMDVSMSSSAETGQLQFVPFQDRIPPLGTPIRLVLVPVPEPTDQPGPKNEDYKKRPTEKILPPAK